MNQLFGPLLRFLHGKDPGFVGALVGLVIALLWVIFGFFKMLFIVLLTLLGYFIGAKYLRNSTHFKDLIDRLLPPGRFR